jgi:hypothetical protein
VLIPTSTQKYKWCHKGLRAEGWLLAACDMKAIPRKPAAE